MDPEDREIMGAIIPGDSVDTPPLQAADVICWHQRKVRAGTLSDTDRRHVSQLNTYGIPHQWELSDLERIAVELNLIGNGHG